MTGTDFFYFLQCVKLNVNTGLVPVVQRDGCFYTTSHTAVADLEREPPPRPPVFKYPMKMKKFGLSEINYFIFIGYLRKMR